MSAFEYFIHIIRWKNDKLNQKMYLPKNPIWEYDSF
jgi:hypothetical protein